MKKFGLISFLVLTLTMSVSAWEYEMPEFEWSIGSDVVSSYLWRGLNLGGLSMQPDLNISYAGVTLDAWLNVGTTDWSFTDMNPELDLSLSYSIAGLTIGVNHQFYFVEDQKFFDFHLMNQTEFMSDDAAEGYNYNQTEVFAEYDFSEIFENVPLTIGWYTYISGDDAYIDNTTLKQAFSTYISATYDWGFYDNFTLSPTIAITPWTSMYNDYEGKFSVANLELKLQWEKELTENASIRLWAQGNIRPFDMQKNNLIISAQNDVLDHSTQRLNGAIGFGFSFY